MEGGGLGFNVGVNGGSIKSAMSDLRKSLMGSLIQIEKDFQIKASIRMDKLKAELQALKEICDEAKKEGDKKMEIEAQLQINKVSAQIANLQGDIDKSAANMEKALTMSPELLLSTLKSNLAEMQERLKELQKLGNKDAEIQARVEIEEAKKNIKELEKEIQASGKKSSTFMQSTLGSAFGGFLYSMGSKIISFFQQGIQKSIELADQLERNKIAFTTMLGSSDAANRMLNDLDSFSNKYAQNRQEVLENSKQLLAMGVSANKLLPTMKSLGDVSSALNVDLSRLAYNYGQVRSQGVLTSRDMKDFAMMGVPLIEELAENLGKSNREIKQMMTDGEITFAMVEEAFQTMTGEGGKFADMMEKTKNTWSGLLTQAQNTLQIIASKVGDLLLPGLKESLYWIERIFQGKTGNTLEGDIRKISDELREMEKVAKIFNDQQAELDERLAKQTITSTEYTNKTNELRRNMEELERQYEELNNKMEKQQFLLQKQKEYSDILKNKSKELGKEQEELVKQMGNLDKSDKNYLKNLDEIKKKIEENNNTQEGLKGAYDILTVYIDEATNSGKDFLEIEKDINDFVLNPSANIDKLKELAIQALQTAGNIRQIQAELLALENRKAENNFLDFMGDSLKELNPFRNPFSPAIGTLDYKIKKQQELLVLETKKNQDKINNITSTNLENLAKGVSELGLGASSISDNLDDITSGGSGKSKSEEAIKALEKEVEKFEDIYDDVIKKQEALGKATDNYKKSVKDLGYEFQREFKKMQEEMTKLQDDYQKTIYELNKAHGDEKENNIKDFVKNNYYRLLEAEKEYGDMLRGSDEDGNDVKFDNEKYNDLRNEIEALKKVLEESEKSLTEKEVEDIKKERDTYFGLKDDAAKSRYDFQEEQKKADEEHQAKLDEETAKYNEQTEALDKKKRLIELINNMNGVSNEDVERIRDSETFQNLSTEDQDTLLNWLNKKAELEEENQEIIRMKQELYTAEQKMLLTNQAMIMRNLDDLDSKYQEIIARIHSAIAAQQEFNGLQSDPSGRGYGSGGYTGAGGKYDVAGVVHKGEYVIPQWLMPKLNGIVSQIEAMRQRGFAEGGMVGGVTNHNVTKNQTNHISVSNQIDLRAFLDRAKRKM